MTEETKIRDVSDTALWVAHYRALESEKPDAVFNDRLAKVLVGERGREIAESMKAQGQHTAWSVIIRTVIIDEFIQRLVRDEGVDTVINLGAGLDTRPYRLELPASLRWIEVDYPQIIEHKTKLLAGEKPRVQLERIIQDLSDRPARQKLFAKLAAGSKKALVLTEGVLPYLSVEQVATLAEDLKAEKKFAFWIAEYFAPFIYKYFKNLARAKKMKNAPFLFYPPDWFGFFNSVGWKKREIGYMMTEGKRVGRLPPMPWWGWILGPFMSKKQIEHYEHMAGYVIYVPEIV